MHPTGMPGCHHHHYHHHHHYRHYHYHYRHHHHYRHYHYHYRRHQHCHHQQPYRWRLTVPSSLESDCGGSVTAPALGLCAGVQGRAQTA